MSLLACFILAAMILTGSFFFSRGRRGRRIDDHPLCARCKFDLTGRPTHSDRCPECGSLLANPFATIIGNRQHNDGLIYAGLAIALLGAFLLMMNIGMSLMHVDPIRFKPMWWLLRDAARNSYDQDKNRDEIYYRAQNNKLSQADSQNVAALALRLQADLARPWNPRWGDIIESLHAHGRLSPTDWQAYLSHDEPATFQVRPLCAYGDPIPYHVHGELRGATPLTTYRHPRITINAAVPGAVTQFSYYGGGFGTTFDVSGTVPLTPASWTALKPGTHILQVSFTGLGTAIATTPALFSPLACQGNWTLLKPGEKSVRLYHDETLAAQVWKTLSCQVRVDSDINISIESDHPPVDLAFDVLIRSGATEYKSPGYWVCFNGGQSNGECMAIISDAQALVGHHADIILRSSIAAAARTMNMDKLLDHEFVFKDVLIDNVK